MRLDIVRCDWCHKDVRLGAVCHGLRIADDGHPICRVSWAAPEAKRHLCQDCWTAFKNIMDYYEE